MKETNIATNFNFDRVSIQPDSSLTFPVCCSSGHMYPYENLFREALNNYMSKQPGSITICNGLLLQILGYLYNESQINVEVFRKMKRIEKALDYLKTYYSCPELQIRELSAAVNMSEKQFRRIFSDIYSFSHCFKKHVGTAPSKFRRY